MTDIKSMTIDELKELMTVLGYKPFRAKQIYSWLHEHLVTSYDEMTNLSKGLREKLKEYPITALEVVDVQTSRLDGTQEISVPPGRRQCDRERSYEIQARKFRLYLFTGGMQDGMQILCFYHRRADQKPATVRNAGSDLQDPDTDRRTGIQCGSDGNRGTAGQL